MKAVEWSLYADEEWHYGSGSLSYTFNMPGYYSATAIIDDIPNKAEALT